jgi:hypothetical protein
MLLINRQIAGHFQPKAPLNPPTLLTYRKYKQLLHSAKLAPLHLLDNKKVKNPI